MIGDGETVEVFLDDEETRAPEVEKKVEPKVEAAPEKQVKEDEIDPEVITRLKQQLETKETEVNSERQARLKIEQHARQLAEEAQRAKQSADQSYYQLVDGYVHQAKSKVSQLEQEIKHAMDAGEYDKFSKLQSELGRVSARLVQYEDAKSDLEARAKKEAERPKIEPTITHGDVFEESIKNLSEPSKQWLRQHRECVLDEPYRLKVTAADKLAQRNGLVPDTKEYFEFVEKQMGYKVAPTLDATIEKKQEQDDDGEVVVIADPKPVKKPMPAAPVSREAGHQGKPMNGKVYLSRAEAEIAENLGMTKAEYAKWKMKAEADGRYTN